MEDIKVGHIIFQIKRIIPGTIHLIGGNIEDAIPDQSALEISAVLDFAVEGESFEEYFQFIDFSLKTNFGTWNESGELSMGFQKKDIKDSYISFEFFAYPFQLVGTRKLSWRLKLNKSLLGNGFFQYLNILWTLLKKISWDLFKIGTFIEKPT